jgi:hypothetical protein
MEKDPKYHVVIKPSEGSKLKFKKEEKKTDKLPEHIGTIFQSREEIKEDRRTFRDFLK